MKNNKGFSLVELIVVIAIMAILAAVAVIGVSVYIPKAQQANDKQLIADIEDILTYEGYAGTFEDGDSGFIVLSKDNDARVQGDALIEALTNAYGADYAKELKLAYDEWANNGLSTGMTAESAWVVAKSNYLTGTRADQLLADVEKMTKVADRLTKVADGSNITTSITQMFTNADGECAIDATAAKYGYSRNEGETWEEWAARTNNQTAYSNLLVLTAADESAAVASGQKTEMSQASSLVLEFSSYYAFAAENEAFAVEFEQYMSDLENIEELGQGGAWFDGLRESADTFGYSTNYKGDDGKYEEDKLAFQLIMSNVSNSANSQPDAIKGGLGQTDFFTQGVVSDMYNDYLTNIDAMQGFFVDGADDQVALNLQPGEVAILFIQKDGVTVISNSLPN